MSRPRRLLERWVAVDETTAATLSVANLILVSCVLMAAWFGDPDIPRPIRIVLAVAALVAGAALMTRSAVRRRRRRRGEELT